MTTETHHVDILIEDDDIALDVAGGVLYVERAVSIAQDLKHAIRESGFLSAMIAERDKELRAYYEQQILLLVEEDTRIVPGSVTFTLTTPTFPDSRGIWQLLADTYQYGQIKVTP